MNTDPQVQAAIAHWGPRFVANGVLMPDFQEVTAGIERWADWCKVWSARAAVHEQLGLQAFDEGYSLSAADHLSRAAVYYHFAKFMFVQDRDEMRAAHLKAVRCRQLAAPLMRPPAKRVEIPFEGGVIAGLLRFPSGIDRPPIVVIVPGLDSAKEELGSYELLLLERGMATLSIDGPGQGEAEYDFPIRGDYETAVSPVVDWLVNRDDVDTGRIGLWGVSLGGYYAPRAAAFEKRIAACVALSGPYDVHDNWDRGPSLSREVFRVRSHSRSMEDAKRLSATLTLRGGIAKRIECPLLLVAGKNDRIIDWQDANRLAAEVRGPVKVLVVEDGNHIANNRTYLHRNQAADWMAVQLGAHAS